MRRIQKVVNDALESMGVDDPPTFSSDNTPWSGFLIERMSVATNTEGRVSLPSAILMIHTGPGRVRYTARNERHDYSLARGTVFVCPKNYELQSPRVDGDLDRIVVELRRPVLNRLFQDDRHYSDLHLLHLVKGKDKLVSMLPRDADRDSTRLPVRRQLRRERVHLPVVIFESALFGAGRRGDRF